MPWYVTLEISAVIAVLVVQPDPVSPCPLSLSAVNCPIKAQTLDRHIETGNKRWSDCVKDTCRDVFGKVSTSRIRIRVPLPVVQCLVTVSNEVALFFQLGLNGWCISTKSVTMHVTVRH